MFERVALAVPIEAEQGGQLSLNCTVGQLPPCRARKVDYMEMFGAYGASRLHAASQRCSGFSRIVCDSLQSNTGSVLYGTESRGIA